MNELEQCGKETLVTEEAPSRDQVISLMAVYLDEWMHRDETLWKQTFKFFYATVIVILLPNFSEYIGLELPPVNERLFPMLGICMALCFFYIGIGYAVRLKASGDTYQRMMDLLGSEGCKRVSIKSYKRYRFFALPLSFVFVLLMFAALILLAVLILQV